MNKAMICIIPAIILGCQIEPTVFTVSGASICSFLSLYFITKYDKERNKKE